MTLRALVGVWLLWVLLLPHAFCWNALGHRVIAQIAYDHVSFRAKQLFQDESRSTNGQMVNFITTATWLDDIRSRKDTYFDSMHYVDIPFSKEACGFPPIPLNNAVSAIESSIRIASTPMESPLRQKTAMRILLHVVGDIHQPLHAATNISTHYPKGDKGGNLVLIRHNAIAKNLHAYWDRGAGFLVSKKKQRAFQVEKLTAQLERRWPCRVHEMDLNPWHWAQESHDAAVHTAYDLPKGAELDIPYQLAAQEVVKQRIAMAGCRLAALLNHIQDVYSHGQNETHNNASARTVMAISPTS